MYPNRTCPETIANTASIAAGAFFTTYERTKSLLNRLNTTSAHPNGVLPTPILHAGASSLAELVSCAILTPAEVIKQNAQMVDSSSSTSTKSKTNATLQTLARFRRNPIALWSGYTALAGRNLPFTALQFPMFERLKELIHAWGERRGTKMDGMVQRAGITAFSAGAAGAVAAVVTTPVDVVKTRIMLSAVEYEGERKGESQKQQPQQEKGKMAKSGQNGNLVDAFGKSVKSGKEAAKRSLQKSKKKSAWKIGAEIVKEKGFVGLWRGGALRAVWTFVGSGLYLGVYDYGRIYLAGRRGEDVDEDDLM